jgi:squalene cyclase
MLKIALALLLSSTTLLPAAPSTAARLQDPVKVDAATEKIILSSLAYLASKQSPSGAWAGETGEEARYPAAITAYALMAFGAAGHLPGEGEFGKNVAIAVRYLLGEIDDQGLIGDSESGQYMYTHGIASIALAELYGQTRNDSLKSKLEKMIKVIVSSQNPEGGWRYRPISRDADISVTVLAVVALRAAKNGGLAVPQKTIDDAVAYVRKCFNERDGGFGYQPGQGSGFARTAAAIYSLQVCGDYDDPMVKTGSKYLFDRFGKNERYFT